MRDDVVLTKDECKYENYYLIQSFYLDWNFDDNGQSQNETINELFQH